MDRYIDNQETQTYGSRFSGNLRRIAGTDIPKALNIVLIWCAERLDGSTRDMAAAMSSQRAASSERRSAAEERTPAAQSARSDLKAFSLHLAARKADVADPWNGDLALFLPGGISSVGKGARALRDSMVVARDALDADVGVPDRARWLARLAARVAELEPIVDRVDDAGHGHSSTLSEQSAEKRAWLKTYRGVALVLEGVLLLTGREGEYTAAVPHLTAPGTRKKHDGAPNVPVGPS